jgi:hypothetical protein
MSQDVEPTLEQIDAHIRANQAITAVGQASKGNFRAQLAAVNVARAYMEWSDIVGIPVVSRTAQKAALNRIEEVCRRELAKEEAGQT